MDTEKILNPVSGNWILASSPWGKKVIKSQSDKKVKYGVASNRNPKGIQTGGVTNKNDIRRTRSLKKNENSKALGKSHQSNLDRGLAQTHKKNAFRYDRAPSLQLEFDKPAVLKSWNRPAKNQDDEDEGGPAIKWINRLLTTMSLAGYSKQDGILVWDEFHGLLLNSTYVYKQLMFDGESGLVTWDFYPTETLSITHETSDEFRAILKLVRSSFGVRGRPSLPLCDEMLALKLIKRKHKMKRGARQQLKK